VTRRTTLRAIETPPTETPAAPIPAPPTSTRQSISRSALAAGGLILIGVAAVAGVLLAGKPDPAPTPTAQAAAVAPACPSVASFLDVITSYERQARWGLAASSAQTALRTPGLCDSDRAALGQKLVALSREALFEQPPAPEDAPGQRRVVTAYTDLKTLATQYHVQTPPPLPVARSAYDNRLYLLATVAYADAFANGDSSAEDRDIVRADYAAQYNLGLVWSKRTDAIQRQDGLARLATACRISERTQLGTAEACTELQTLLGSRARWPQPLADPLIDTLPPVTPARGL
jgi:hypothetical protein